MKTKLRDYGDGEMVVLHTEDDRLYQILKESPELVKEMEYTLDDCHGSVVAIDLYFPKDHRDWLELALKHYKKTGALPPFEGKKS